MVDGLTQKDLRNLTQNILERIEEDIEEDVPEIIIREYGLVGKTYALKTIHYPLNQDTLEEAKRRLIFDELFLMQLALHGQRENDQRLKRFVNQMEQ